MKQCHPNLMFAGKAQSHLNTYAILFWKAPHLLTKIWPVWKWLIGENALAYFAKALFLSPKDFKHFAPGNIFSLTLLKKFCTLCSAVSFLSWEKDFVDYKLENILNDFFSNLKWLVILRLLGILGTHFLNLSIH